MADEDELNILEQRIAIVRENLRNLIEQAASYSGAANEALASNRIAHQENLLDQLLSERDALEKE